ncbi:MAG TPA: calcium-binding protein [Solirubrobacteraceae bacterium]|jgi:Ca2+-binding RTX toxin-like protein
MRRALVILTAVAAMTGTADAAAPVRGGALCWDFDRVGTDSADHIEGTSGPEHVAAYAGDDEVLAFGGDDCVAAGAGDDVLHLGPGNDEAAAGAGADAVFGGPGNDVLLPGLGADRVEGGEGDDLIRSEPGDGGADRLDAGPGDDVVRAVNGGADTVLCGPGYDVVIVDRADAVTECERVVVARRPAVEARTLRTGLRPAFSLRWRRGEVAAADVTVTVTQRPSPRPGCAVGAWELRGRTLRWRGRLGACPGEYAFALTATAGRDAPPAACERLLGAPPAGCAPAEQLGAVVVPVR